jgi:exodeoxyribonuclease VII large subunit
MVNGLCQNQEKNPDLDSYFTAGFETMCYAIPIFHEKYGLSLKITDIDTAYTIGAIELRKEALFKQIRDEGLDQINIKLPYPTFQRLAIISSESGTDMPTLQSILKKMAYGFAFKLHSLTASCKETIWNRRF